MDTEMRIQSMIRLINQEANEKAELMLQQTKQRMQKQKNKVYNEEKAKLISIYKKKKSQLTTQKRLQNSRKINRVRLDVQKFRNALIEKI